MNQWTCFFQEADWVASFRVTRTDRLPVSGASSEPPFTLERALALGGTGLPSVAAVGQMTGRAQWV